MDKLVKEGILSKDISYLLIDIVISLAMIHVKGVWAFFKMDDMFSHFCSIGLLIRSMSINSSKL